MKVLVTGATGFIGRSLCPALRGRGFAVRAAVRGEPALPADIEIAKIDTLGPATRWSAAVSGVDAIVHLAGRAHVLGANGADEAAKVRAVNMEATVHLARAAIRAGVRRFVFVSTAKVHGEQNAGRPWTEQDPPAPQDLYAVSKWEAEQALAELSRTSALEVVVLRPPLVYGPGVKANFLRLLRTVDRGLPVPLGAIRNRRSLVYVGNLADAIATSIDRPAAANRTFLVSDGEDVSTPELIRRVAAALDRPARLVSVPLWMLRLGARLLGRGADFERLVGELAVDASAIRRELGWQPPYSMQSGLEATAKWYRSLVNP
ncbi:MAG: SDR family oxidoreductase [Burkholderiales bacterium]|nr:SDR family oxidoreductase [Burkholderiales bacterium]